MASLVKVQYMNQRLSLPTALILTVPPLMWAGNAVVGRLAADLIPPLTLNFLRWVIAFLILLPITWHILRPTSSLWPVWRRYLLLGLLGVGCYNALMYLALTTSTALNVTLVGASVPVWMLLIGTVFFRQRISTMQALGSVLSMAGVVVVLTRGDISRLGQIEFVAGDFYMVLASISWAFYSWLLVSPAGSQPKDPADIRSDWAAFLMAQMVFGLGWAGVFAGGEWALTDARISWGWPLLAVLLYVAIGPAILAYRCWGIGVQRVGPAMASFFGNLTPLIAALLSAAFLGELPKLYHALAFVLIIGGILVSSRR
jgi:drug/metabolite transporter (DMT)-like permease